MEIFIQKKKKKRETFELVEPKINSHNTFWNFKLLLLFFFFFIFKSSKCSLECMETGMRKTFQNFRNTLARMKIFSRLKRLKSEEGNFRFVFREKRELLVLLTPSFKVEIDSFAFLINQICFFLWGRLGIETSSCRGYEKVVSWKFWFRNYSTDPPSLRQVSLIKISLPL